MLPADMVGGVSATRAANLEVSGEALGAFMNRVDAVLRDLESSAANPAKVGAQTVNAVSLNSGSEARFPEARELHDQYGQVHDKLTILSKTLHLQIEAIGIAVKGARIGFDDLEEDQRRRFWEIQTQIGVLQGETGGKHSGDAETGTL